MLAEELSASQGLSYFNNSNNHNKIIRQKFLSVLSSALSSYFLLFRLHYTLIC
jgi:hypothetical protein